MVVRRSRAFWRWVDEVEAASGRALAHGQRAAVLGAVRRLRRGHGLGVGLVEVRAAAALARSKSPDWELVMRYLSLDERASDQ